MTDDQIERLYTYIMFNHDKVSTTQLEMILGTDLKKEMIND